MITTAILVSFILGVALGIGVATFYESERRFRETVNRLADPNQGITPRGSEGAYGPRPGNSSIGVPPTGGTNIHKAND